MSTYLLFVLAFIGTAAFVINITKRSQKVEVEYEVGDGSTKKTISSISSQGCGCGTLIHQIVYLYIVEPAAVFTALSHKIGNRYIAYAMIGIIALNWAYRVYLSMKLKRYKDKIKATFKDPSDTAGISKVALAEYNKHLSPALIFISKIFFAIPDFYLWYLFFIIIGVIAQ